MGQVETVMVVVLIALAGLLGLLMGGAGAWFAKPSGESKVIDKVTNKYVCYDGAVKNAQKDCPVIKTDSSGNPALKCPVCQQGGGQPGGGSCDCASCLSKCAPGVTTTTIAQPVCKSCKADADCGAAAYGDMRCNKDVMYRMYNEPFCKEGCCVGKETRNDIRSCTDTERCDPRMGCIVLNATELDTGE